MMVFILLSANTRVLSCLSALVAIRRPIHLPATALIPQPAAPISKPSTIGAATMVVNRPTPPIPSPVLIAISVVSMTSIVSILLWYFFYTMYVVDLVLFRVASVDGE